MFQLVLRKQFDKLEKEWLIHCLNTIAFVYRWILLLDMYTFYCMTGKKVNQSLIKTHLKKIQLICYRIFIFFGAKKNIYKKMLKKELYTV